MDEQSGKSKEVAILQNRGSLFYTPWSSMEKRMKFSVAIEWDSM